MVCISWWNNPSELKRRCTEGWANSTFEFRAEYQTFRGEGPVLRFDAKPIAHHVEGVDVRVVESEGKFAAQLGQGGFQTLMLVKAEQDLRITLAAELQALGDEIGPDILESVELAVVGHQQVPILRNKGLTGTETVQVDDRQAGMTEAHARSRHAADAKAVRTAMHLDCGHVDQQLFIDRLLEGSCEKYLQCRTY